jgi:hypothetical protein
MPRTPRSLRTRRGLASRVASLAALAVPLAAATVVASALAPADAGAQSRLTSPEQFFGHRIGADYRLPNYTKLHEYFATIARESERVVLDTIGVTEEGRPQIMAIVTSPENHRNLARYKEISRRLALAEFADSAEARRLAREGKAVIWIDGGLHATEVLGAQQLIETFWQLSSLTDEETLRFLDDCIILMAHANPDGMELVSDWYMRSPDSLRRSTGGLPRLYQKYAGHDNNRDSYMNALKETENMSRQLFIEWHPVIMYNHHQTGPQGTVMFAPPFRDPANYNFHPLIITGLDVVGSAMHNRFVMEGKGGTVMRSGANYSTWWNGGLRTTVYFHNMIGLLTETIGNPTPMRIPLVPARQLRSGDQPLPIEPQLWRFRQSIDYSVTANRAVLDVASKNREQFLFNRWQMGRDQVAAGTRDTWTVWPTRVAKLTDSLNRLRAASAAQAAGSTDALFSLLRRPEDRDPKAYVLSSAQVDFPTATKFVRALQKSGVVVHRATAPFSAGGRSYPAGSWVFQMSQAFRPHLLDMFEPQDHPNDFRFPGGPPIPPYDNAGWTLAFQMGIEYDRLMEPVTASLEQVPDVTPSPAGRVAKGRAGYLVHAGVNDGLTVANRLVKRNVAVFRTTGATTIDGVTYPTGSWFIPAGGAADQVVTQAAQELGVSFAAADARPAAARVRPLRIGVWDRYGGAMPAGWTRLILEQFEMPFTTVYAKELDAGNLNRKYDVLLFVDGGIPAMRGGRGGGMAGGGASAADSTLIPAEYWPALGNVSAERTIPQLKAFLENGGRVITIGSSTALAQHLGLPVENHLLDNGRPLTNEQYYIPGSLLEVAVDTSASVARGMRQRATVMFDNSPVMKLGADAAAKGVRAIATFDTKTPLRSGWAWGQERLQGGVAIAEATVGKGTLYLFGPEVLFRAQPHGTFKFVFNTFYDAR